MRKEFAKIMEIAGSSYVLIPKTFIRNNNLVKGQFLQRTVSDNEISFVVVD